MCTDSTPSNILEVLQDLDQATSGIADRGGRPQPVAIPGLIRLPSWASTRTETIEDVAADDHGDSSEASDSVSGRLGGFA